MLVDFLGVMGCTVRSPPRVRDGFSPARLTSLMGGSVFSDRGMGWGEQIPGGITTPRWQRCLPRSPFNTGYEMIGEIPDQNIVPGQYLSAIPNIIPPE